MVDLLGYVHGKPHEPCIYFIVVLDYLYIGETSRLVIRRWGEHLGTNGSFLKRMLEVDPEAVSGDMEISFVGFRCGKIRDLDTPAQKSTLQYLEHKIHERIICHPDLGPCLQLVSDTSRTAPTYCRYTWVEDLAKELVGAFHDFYTQK